MRFRPYDNQHDRNAVIALTLAPRSLYVLADEIRWAWQHSIPPGEGVALFDHVPHARVESPADDRVSATARTARSRLHDAAQSRADGLDAHGPRGSARTASRSSPRSTRRARAAASASSSPAASRRISSGGSSRARRNCRSAGRSRKHRQVTDAVHAAGGRIALQILHAGRYAYHPLSVAPSAIALADHAVQAARADALGHRAHDRRLRALRAARAARGLRRRRDHGLRGLPDQPVHRAADESPRRRLGRRVREPHPLRRRDRAAHARGRRAASSSSSTGCRCSISSKAAARGTKSSRSRRPSRRRARR